MKIHTLLMMG